MRQIFLSLIAILFVTDAAAQFSDAVPKITKKGMHYREVVVTVQSPLERCAFFSCSVENVTLHGLLWIPGKGNPPYKLIVLSHGAQGPTPFHPKGIEPDDGLAGEFFANGYALMMAYRKGRSVNDLPEPEISADTAESNQCRDDMKPGLRSATSDVEAYINALRTRPDLDTKKIILMGSSRGGFVSLSVASKGVQGVIGVITISAGWLSEYAMWGSEAGTTRCNKGANEAFLTEFGEKVRVPVLALYGGKDPFQSAETYRKYMSYLGKYAPADFLIVPDADHRALLGSAREAWEEKQNRFLRLIDP